MKEGKIRRVEAFRKERRSGLEEGKKKKGRSGRTYSLEYSARSQMLNLHSDPNTTIHRVHCNIMLYIESTLRHNVENEKRTKMTYVPHP